MKARHQGKLVTNQRSHLLNQHKDMVQHQVKETRLLEPRLHHTNAGTTPTAQASVNVRLVKPAGESHFRKACAWKRETLKAKEMPKAKKEKAKSKVLRAKGKKKGKEKGGKRPGKTPPPPPPAKKRPLVTEPGPSAKARQEQDAEYSHYSESDAEPKASASEARPSEKFLQLIKEGAQARQRGREEPAAAAAAAAKPEPSSSESSSACEEANQPEPEPNKPGVNQEKEDQASTEEARQAMADMEIEPTEPADSPRDVAMIEVNLGGPGEENPGASKPGNPRSNQETRQSATPNAASSTEPGENQESKAEVKVEPPGAEPGSDCKSPEGPVEEPEEASQAKEEDRGGQTSSTDSVYEPIVLREAPVTPGSTGHPMPNYSETMEFRVEVKKLR